VLKSAPLDSITDTPIPATSQC